MQNQFSIQCFKSKLPQALRNVSSHSASVFYINRGVKNLSWGDGLIQVDKAHLLVVPARQQINFVNVPDDGQYIAWQFSLPLRLPNYLSEQLFGANARVKVEQARQDNPLVEINDDLALILETAVQSKQAENSESMQLHYIYGLILALASSFDVRPLYLNREASIVERVVQHISWLPSKDWKAQQLADSLAMSESTLRRKLSEQGVCFRDLLLDVRLSHGLVSLQTLHFSLPEVALMCGYNSYDRFSRQFKTKFGLTPREYRSTCV